MIKCKLFFFILILSHFQFEKSFAVDQEFTVIGSIDGTNVYLKQDGPELFSLNPTPVIPAVSAEVVPTYVPGAYAGEKGL